MATLELGPTPGRLSLNYVLDDPWNASAILKLNGVPVAWEAAPVLVFASGVTWISTLTELNTKASWSRTVADITALHNSVDVVGRTARCKVAGITQWVGDVTRSA